MLFLLCKCANNGLKNSDEKCNCGELILDVPYNHYYLKERTFPFTGTCIMVNSNGTINFTKDFVDGKMHGNMIRYRSNGTKLSSVEFDKNFINGKAIVYDINGKDSIIQQYKRGELISK